MATVLSPPTPSAEPSLSEPAVPPIPPVLPSIDELQNRLSAATRQWCNEGDSAEVVAAYASCLSALVERARE